MVDYTIYYAQLHITLKWILQRVPAAQTILIYTAAKFFSLFFFEWYARFQNKLITKLNSIEETKNKQTKKSRNSSKNKIKRSQKQRLRECVSELVQTKFRKIVVLTSKQLSAQLWSHIKRINRKQVKMTVTYTAEVATCRGFGCFLKLLFRWVMFAY